MIELDSIFLQCTIHHDHFTHWINPLIFIRTVVLFLQWHRCCYFINIFIWRDTSPFFSFIIDSNCTAATDMADILPSGSPPSYFWEWLFYFFVIVAYDVAEIPIPVGIIIFSSLNTSGDSSWLLCFIKCRSSRHGSYTPYWGTAPILLRNLFMLSQHCGCRHSRNSTSWERGMLFFLGTHQ